MNRLVLLLIELPLVAAAAALLGARYGLPLLAVAACAPLVVAAAWLAGIRAGLALSVCAMLGWYLPHTVGVSTSGGPDHLSAILSGVLLLGFALLADRWRNSHRLARLAAEEDPLTGLLNRRGFLARVEAERNRSTRTRSSLAVAYIDCDRFKKWNDTRGHAAGDQALILIAEVLRANVRNYDSVARLGGDEFGILFPDADETAARAAGERLLTALNAVFRNREWPLTCSMGIAVFPVPQLTADMLAAADAELYAVKQSDRGRCRVRTFAAHEGSAAANAP